MTSTHHGQSPEGASGQKTTWAPLQALPWARPFPLMTSLQLHRPGAVRTGKRKHLESGWMTDCTQVALATPGVHTAVPQPRAIIPDGVYILHTCRWGCGGRGSSSSLRHGIGLEMSEAIFQLRQD